MSAHGARRLCGRSGWRLARLTPGADREPVRFRTDGATVIKSLAAPPSGNRVADLDGILRRDLGDVSMRQADRPRRAADRACAPWHHAPTNGMSIKPDHDQAESRASYIAGT
jgi:hypothetical protein